MRAVQPTRCPRQRADCEVRRIALGVLTIGFLCAPAASAAPYVSCLGGYIAPEVKDCPPVPKHPVGGPHRHGGGGGVVGDLLDSLGLGGLL